MTDENYEASAQAHLASLKRDMRVSLEDAVVRAVHKVMAEFEAKSDHQLMENAQGDLERIKLVQTGVGIGKPEQEPVAWYIREKDVATTDGEWAEKNLDMCEPLYTTPPQRKPLTDEQRFDLLTKFEPHKNKWEAPSILIDMVEAAHGIKE